jgi:hypothetical protein
VSLAALAADTGPRQSYFASPLAFEAHGNLNVSRGAGYALNISSAGTVLNLSGGILRMRMVGGQASPRVEAVDPLPGLATYYLGSEPGQSYRTYGRVLNVSVYSGIDLVFHGNRNRLEYDFQVAAGRSAAAIALAFDGASRVDIDSPGYLVLHAGAVSGYP